MSCDPYLAIWQLIFNNLNEVEQRRGMEMILRFLSIEENLYRSCAPLACEWQRIVGV